ncbi:MAG: YjbQ family protein [Methanobacteriota archaeon]|nr:MAG: YjbQ family protein [Euryarchaeota archaeon]
MSFYSDTIELQTRGEVDIMDITNDIAGIVRKSGLSNGIACVFTPSSTSAITTIEYEPGLLKDLPDALEKLFPKGARYEHEMRWHDGNGHSHVRASFMSPSLSIPFVEGNPVLGTWQQIVFVELDNKSRNRRLLVHLVGE